MERWALGGALIVLLILLSAPLADATPADGALKSRGKLDFPEGSSAETAPLVTFIPPAEGLGTVLVSAPKVTVLKFQADLFAPDGADLPRVKLGATARQSWPLTNLVLTVPGATGKEGGMMGIFPGADASLRATGDLEMEARDGPADFGDLSASGEGERPDSFAFGKRIQSDHFVLSGRGELEHSGAQGLKVFGFDMHLESAQNVSAARSGFERTSPTTIRATWYYFQFDAPATVRLNEGAFIAATGPERATWDGPLRFSPTEGRVRSAETEYVPNGSAAVLDGAFSAQLVPRGNLAAEIELSGELRATTLSSSALVPIPGAAGGTTLWAPWVLGAILASGGGAATAVLVRRRKQREELLLPPSARAYYRAAKRYMEAEEFALALEPLMRARQVAPTTARLALDTAFCHERLGHTTEALRSLEEVDALDAKNGEAAYRAALLLRERDLGQAYAWLRIALAKTPGLVRDVEEEFPGVTTDAQWARDLLDAYRAAPAAWTDRHGR